MTASVLAVIGLLYWGLQLAIVLRVMRGVPLLHELPEAGVGPWPRVSAILTARNEEHALEEAVRARFAEDYPEFELILVDDRSTDRTSEIAERLAAADPRLKLVHIRSLPEGWLGKLNALHKGLERASGDWLLFSDADVSVQGGVLRRLIQHCESRGFDHCAVLPRLRPVNPLLDCLTSIFMRMVALNLRIWQIEDPNSSVGVGIGAFNLVRRSALEHSPGLVWLKMEVADDICLGQMLKACGARQSVVNGREGASLVFHRSIGDSLTSAERATFTAVGNFSLARLCLLALVILFLESTPLLACVFARTPQAFGLAGLLLAVALAAQIASNVWQGRRSWNLVLFPLASLLVAFSQVRSGVLGLARGGIRWRGTFYPTATLREGARFGKGWKELRAYREARIAND